MCYICILFDKWIIWETILCPRSYTYHWHFLYGMKCSLKMIYIQWNDSFAGNSEENWKESWQTHRSLLPPPQARPEPSAFPRKPPQGSCLVTAFSCLNAGAEKYSIPVILLFSEHPVNRIIWYVAFWSGFSHLAQCNWDSLTQLHLSIAGHFLLLRSIPLYKVSTSIHWLKDSWTDKHDFSYLNDSPSYRYTKPYAKSSVLLEFLVPPHYK